MQKGTTYLPPEPGILPYLPKSWVPYAELMRIEKPAGIYLAYIPHLVGTLYGACIVDSKPSFSVLIKLNLVFFIGTILARGAACSWNDSLDQKFDRQVFRCKPRPLARGAVTTEQAHVFIVLQVTIAFVSLLILPSACLYVAAPSIFLSWLYPFSKRFTNYR